MKTSFVVGCMLCLLDTGNDMIFWITSLIGIVFMLPLFVKKVIKEK